MKWHELDYWNSGEWQVVRENLRDLVKRKILYCPSRNQLFDGMRACPFDDIRVCIIGQDPYPNPAHANGIAFSVPENIKEFPPSLKNIFKEYQDDLHYPEPKSGDLSPWCKQGVFLWNAVPSCTAGQPGSHSWPEWTLLTQEIVEKLDARGGLVFIFLGAVAGNYAGLVSNCPVIKTSHPSPLGSRHGFLGSRIFTTANVKLKEIGVKQIDWRL